MGGGALAGTLVWQLHLHSAAYRNGHVLLFCIHRLLAVAFAAIIVATCSERVRDLRIPHSRPALFVGTVSYSLYP